MSEDNYPIVVIKDENDVEHFLNMVRTHGRAAFRVDMSISRLEAHNWVDLVNEKYKEAFANSNTELARVA